MSVPLQSQLFNAFLGEQEAIHSIILPDIFSSGGSKNVYMDKFARAKKVSGYAKQNSSAYTTNTGGSTARVRALFPYRGTSGGSTTRQLMFVLDDATNEWEIWTSTYDGATGTFRYDAGSGSINMIPDFAQFGDTVYITNGKVAPRKLDGTTLGAAGRTQSPTPTTALSASLGPQAGNYKYKLVSMIASERQAGSVASTSLSVQGFQVDLDWTLDSNTNVTGYEIYRTTGTGEVYYFLTYLDARATVSYTDNADDNFILENRVLEEHGDAPPTCYFAEPHKQRVWWGRTDTYPTRAYWSDAGLPEDVLTTNYLDFSDSSTVGDILTGMVGDFDGRMVVFTEKAVWAVSGSGQVIGDITDWTRVKTDAQVGSVSHRTAARIPAGAQYVDAEGKKQLTISVTLAYLTPLGDVRLFDGENDVVISSPEKTTVATLNYAQRAKSFSVTDTPRSEVTWIFPGGSSGEPDTAVTWNYRWGVWYKRDWDFAHAIENDDSSTASVLLAAEGSLTTGGYIYKLWSGNSNDGASIEAIWMSKTLYGINEDGQPQTELQKRWRWGDFLFETDATTTLTVEWLSGDAADNAPAVGSTTISPTGEAVLSAGGDAVLSSDGDAVLAGRASTGAIALFKDSSGINLHSTGLRLRVGDNASSGSWSLEGLKLVYQALPGLDRRMP